MIVGAVIPSHLTAQRRGGHGGAVARPGFGYSGISARPGFGHGGISAGRVGPWRDWGWNHRIGLPGVGNLGYGWGYGGGFASDSFLGYPPFYSDFAMPATYGEGNQTPPSIIVLMPVPAPPEPLPPPPAPVIPVVHEYKWPNDGGDPKATFSIVSKNGLVRQAVAVWVQEKEVRFIATDGSGGRMAMASADCSATQRMNALNKLRLPLQGCGSVQ